MTEIHLAFKSFDVHELLCHAIAESSGLYSAAGLSISLLDATFLSNEDLPAPTFHAACGASLADFLRGERRKVVFIACDKPMFWLYGRAGIDSLEQIEQARIATYTDAAPPAYFLRKLLSDAGVAATLLSCRDDIARLALLSTKNVDAALLSSLYLPFEVESRGVNRLAFIGEKLRIPSSGLAVSGELFDTEPEIVARMVRIYREAMNYIYDDDETTLRRVLVKVFNMPVDGLDDAVQVIRECYNPAGQCEESLLQSVVDSVAKGMGLEPRSAAELYEFY